VSIERVLASMPPFWTAMARGAGGRVLERHGITACIVPSVPDRSLPNSVLYEDAEKGVSVLDHLEAAYAHAGVHAWTVWVHPRDDALADELARRGHVLDAEPEGMVLDDLAALAPPATPPGLDVVAGGPAELGRLNDLAYGLAPDTLAPLFPGIGDRLHVHLVRADGKVMGGAGIFDAGDDAELTFVATDPGHQRRGYGALAVAHALAAARERGARGSTLQATKAGRPLYARLGYRPVGPLRMWERRF
jgi:GNAT superfamily N-acetyltransferase